MNCSATVMPTAVTEPDSSRTIQSWAIRCIQMAITATKWPMAKMRKLGTFREMNVCFQGSRSLTTAMGWVWRKAGGVDDGLADGCRRWRWGCHRGVLK